MSYILRFAVILTTAIGIGAIASSLSHVQRPYYSYTPAPNEDESSSSRSNYSTEGRLLELQTSNSLEGIWHSDGYGLLLEIDANRIRASQITSINCLPAWTAVRQLGPGNG